jgi:hypothetical protein
VWFYPWVVEDEQEDAVEDEEVVQEEDLSDEEVADSVGPVEWVVGACVGGAGEWRRGGTGGLRASGCR